MDYKQASRDFVENEKQFHLGVIPTEQSNPLTRNLSAKIMKDTAEGIRTILAADVNIPQVAAACFETEAFKCMVKDIRRAMDERRTVLFSSVGASGRMALQLDATWRKFWTGLVEKIPLKAKAFLEISECSNSLMTGGDRAVVRSVENFEDYMTFGAQQIIDAGVGAGDVVIALAECGLSASINGSAIEADNQGCTTYYLFCNPEEVLRKYLDRARVVFERERIIHMPLFVGNMAVSGSTRMQVTTVELLVAGAALELASWSWLEDNLTPDELKAVGAGVLAAECRSTLSFLRAANEPAVLARANVAGSVIGVDAGGMRGALQSMDTQKIQVIKARVTDVEAEALRLELEEIQAMRDEGRLTRDAARELREEVYLLQMATGE